MQKMQKSDEKSRLAYFHPASECAEMQAPAPRVHPDAPSSQIFCGSRNFLAVKKSREVRRGALRLADRGRAQEGGASALRFCEVGAFVVPSHRRPSVSVGISRDLPNPGEAFCFGGLGG